MDYYHLDKAIEHLKKDLGEALLSSNIWNKDACLSMASYNSNDNYAALLGNVLNEMEQTLTELGLPTFGNYQIIELDMDTLILILNFEGEFFWGNIIDKNKITIGLLFLIVIPKALKYLSESILNSEKL